MSTEPAKDLATPTATEAERAARASALLVAENVTLWTVIAAVSLFAAGQIAHAYQLNTLGVRGLHLEAAWQDRVFEGGLAVLNSLLQLVVHPERAQLRWLTTAMLMVACLVTRRRIRSSSWRVVLAALAGCSYLATIISLSIISGENTAGYLRERPGTEHFVFTADSQSRMPPSLLQDNDARKLRMVLSTADLVVVLGQDGQTIYRISTRDIDVQESSPPKLQ